MEEPMTPEDNARMILEKLHEGSLWEPAGLGLSYVKTGPKSLLLTQQQNNPTSAQARIRMKMLVESVGWTIDESEVQLVDVENLSPQERHMQEMMMRQEAAQRWPCPECKTPLAAFPLEEGVWRFDGQQDLATPDGDIVKDVEQWSVVITCPVCDTEVPTEPYDYALLAGEDAMMIYRTKYVKYVALSRPEIIEVMDKDRADREKEVVVLGTFCPFNGDLLPPHVRGSVVTFSAIDEEE